MTICANLVLSFSIASLMCLLDDIVAAFCIAILLVEVDGRSIQSYEVSLKIR